MPLTEQERGLVVELCAQIGACFASLINFATTNSANHEAEIISEFGKLGNRIADVMEED